MDIYQNATRQPHSHQSPVTMTQAQRLARLTGLAVEELAGQPLTSVERRLRWVLPPEMLGLRKVSGRVVRRNPLTGTLEPVPNAVVHVEDSDCSFLLYSPPQWADWTWLLPFHHRREEIAVAVTDAQGHWSVGIPRWDIEAIASWRHGRIGFGDFSRPRLRDLVKDLDSEGGLDLKAQPMLEPNLLARCRRRVGQVLTDEIEALLQQAGTNLTQDALDMLLETPVAPPRPTALDEIVRGDLRSDLAVHGLPQELIQGFGFDRAIGPLWRNSDVVLKLWTLLLDVPDITFRVTGGNRDFDAEPFDSDGFFAVPWSRGSIPELTLSASAGDRGLLAGPRRRTEQEVLSATFPESSPLWGLQIPRFDSTSVF